MIQSLKIRNVALIEEVDVMFHSGLQVLSGETGAGKSILVDAITLILGGRADRDLIRTGSEKASVEAVFSVDENKALHRKLEEESIEDDGKTLTVYREISRSGRNICRINGILVPLSTLKDLAPMMINLHGQSEYQFLADAEKHLGYLDLMGGREHQALRKNTEEEYRKFIINHRAYAQLRKKNEDKENRMNILRRELEELHNAESRPGEEEELKKACRRMEQAARIHGKVNHAYQALVSGEDGSGTMTALKTAAKELRGLEGEDKTFGEMADKCESLFYEMEEIAFQLNGLKERYEYDPNHLENMENRLESIRRIERKFGSTEEEVLQAQEEREEEYKALCSLDEQIVQTGAEHKRLLAAYRNAARILTESRKQIAAVFETNMQEELRDLGMAQTKFSAAFLEEENGRPRMPSADGDDRVEFMISPNPGEPLKPLSKIASGGELSRLMLAMKTIESGRAGTETMIFDEIDSGISGRMAQAVAEKMIRISRRQQVICISHLPQIAAAADRQYLVHKSVQDGRTRTEVEEMDPENRQEEIARMISGAGGITENARIYAGQMICAAEQIKSGI